MNSMSQYDFLSVCMFFPCFFSSYRPETYRFSLIGDSELRLCFTFYLTKCEMYSTFSAMMHLVCICVHYRHNLVSDWRASSSCVNQQIH